ncbi:hypothetical protein OQA88_1291 [Cercophora sp. LCS_1]
MSIPRSPLHYGSSFITPLRSTLPDSLSPENNRLPAPFVALITGASRGIGQQIATTFAAAGATGLILTARSLAALAAVHAQCIARSPHPSRLRITLLAVDLTLPATAAATIRDAMSANHDRLDALINNAGVVSTDPSAWAGNNVQDAGLDQVAVPMTVNYVARFAVIQACLKDDLTVISVRSECAHFTGWGPLGFCVSELAGLRLGEALAERLEDRRVRVYTVHPGMVRTGRPAGMPEDVHALAGDDAGLCGGFCLRLCRERPAWLSGCYLSAKWDVEGLKMREREVVEGGV